MKNILQSKMVIATLGNIALFLGGAVALMAAVRS